MRHLLWLVGCLIPCRNVLCTISSCVIILKISFNNISLIFQNSTLLLPAEGRLAGGTSVCLGNDHPRSQTGTKTTRKTATRGRSSRRCSRGLWPLGALREGIPFVSFSRARQSIEKGPTFLARCKVLKMRFGFHECTDSIMSEIENFRSK